MCEEGSSPPSLNPAQSSATTVDSVSYGVRYQASSHNVSVSPKRWPPSPHLRERLQVPFNAAPHHHHLLRLEPRLPGYTRLGLGHLVQKRRRPLATDPPRAVPEYRGRIEEGWVVAVVI